jgi:hypothetical protein
MKKIRYIAFFLSLAVMLGHDLIPHTHEMGGGLPEEAVSAPISETDFSLAHLFGHFKHNTASANTLEYQVQQAKQTNTNRDVFLPPHFTPAIDDGIAWYTNLKKQRFWETTGIYHQFILHSFPHRGPPALYTQV